MGARGRFDLKPAPAPALDLQAITCVFTSRDAPGQRYTAVQDVNLAVAPGEFVSVVGPTGCGKSTLLNVGAGLLAPSRGRVEVFGQPLQGLNGRAGYMFQAESLMPWKTAQDNVMAGLVFAGVPAPEAADRARAWLQRVGLAGFEDRYPHQLSGGMRKRVAMAQTLILDPDIILMDEPFSALDVQTRQLMENELLELWAEPAQGKTGEADRFAAEWEKSRPRDAAFLYYRADLALAQKDYPLAEARYRAVLGVQPANPLALNNVAWLMVQQKKPGALEQATKAAQILPNQPAVLDTLALAQAFENKIKEAVETQRKAVALAPKDNSLRLNLARLLVQAGDKQAARDELKALEKLGAQFPQQQQVEELLKSVNS
jgi:NitT/TauT family transport system ATP-binding protein